MKMMMWRIICLAMLVALANAATFVSRLPHIPRHLAHKQGCYVREIDDVLPFGGEVTVVGCHRVECSRHRIYYSTCGVVSTEDQSCYVTDVDNSQQYPDCCPTVQCDSDNSIY